MDDGGSPKSGAEGGGSYSLPKRYPGKERRGINAGLPFPSILWSPAGNPCPPVLPIALRDDRWSRVWPRSLGAQSRAEKAGDVLGC